MFERFLLDRGDRRYTTPVVLWNTKVYKTHFAWQIGVKRARVQGTKVDWSLDESTH